WPSRPLTRRKPLAVQYLRCHVEIANPVAISPSRPPAGNRPQPGVHPCSGGYAPLSPHRRKLLAHPFAASPALSSKLRQTPAAGILSRTGKAVVIHFRDGTCVTPSDAPRRGTRHEKADPRGGDDPPLDDGRLGTGRRHPLHAAGRPLPRGPRPLTP